jgi:hypothetical protein
MGYTYYDYEARERRSRFRKAYTTLSLNLMFPDEEETVFPGVYIRTVNCKFGMFGKTHQFHYIDYGSLKKYHYGWYKSGVRHHKYREREERRDYEPLFRLYLHDDY